MMDALLPAGLFSLVFTMLSWIFCVFQFPPMVQKNMPVRFIDNSKLSIGVSVSVVVIYVSPVMDWKPVKVLPLPFVQRELDLSKLCDSE